MVLVQLRKDDGNLPLPEGVVERVVDGLRKDSQPRRRVAIDGEVGPQSAVKLVGGYIAQFRRRA